MSYKNNSKNKLYTIDPYLSSKQTAISLMGDLIEDHPIKDSFDQNQLNDIINRINNTLSKTTQVIQDINSITNLFIVYFFKPKHIIVYVNTYDQNQIKEYITQVVDGLNKYTAHLEILKKKYTSIKKTRDLYSSFSISIGGSFSAGKSTFLNRLLFDNIPNVSLPEDTKPTSSIPTEIYCGEWDELNVKAINIHNCPFQFTSNKMLSIFKHDFESRHKFRLSNIVTKLQIFFPSKELQNVLFIDTPGYNKSDKEINQEDRKIAINAINESDALFWLVPATNGTIKESDWEILEQFKGSKIIIFTKIDQREEWQHVFKKAIDQFKSRGISDFWACNTPDNELYTFDTKTNSFKQTSLLEKVKAFTNQRTIFNTFSEFELDSLNHDLDLLKQQFKTTLVDIRRKNFTNANKLYSHNSGILYTLIEDLEKDIKAWFYASSNTNRDITNFITDAKKIGIPLHGLQKSNTSFLVDIDQNDLSSLEAKLYHGINFDIQNDLRGLSPLHYMIEEGKNTLALYILENISDSNFKKIDKTKKGKSKLTIVETAVLHQNKEVLSLLKKRKLVDRNIRTFIDRNINDQNFKKWLNLNLS